MFLVDILVAEACWTTRYGFRSSRNIYKHGVALLRHTCRCLLIKQAFAHLTSIRCCAADMSVWQLRRNKEIRVYWPRYGQFPVILAELHSLIFIADISGLSVYYTDRCLALPTTPFPWIPRLDNLRINLEWP